ncbi:MAG: type 4 pilus major pilin [Pseudomonadota bacterium]
MRLYPQRICSTKSRHRQTGLSLTDTLLTIVIGGFILSGVGILFVRGIADNKTNVALQQYITMQKAVRSLYATQGDFSGLDNTVMYASGFVPPDIRTNVVDDMRNVWGGQVNVAVNAGNTDRFDISFAEVPPDSCTRIVSFNAVQEGSTDGLDSIIVTANGADTTFSVFPANVADVFTACDDVGDSAVITWVLY